MTSILAVFFFILLLKLQAGKTEINSSNSSVDDRNIFQPGHVIGSYVLRNRLEYIPGLENIARVQYHSNLLWGDTTYDDAHNYLTLATDTSNEITTNEEAASSQYLTTLDEVKRSKNSSCVRNGSYCLADHIFHGGHGDIWRANAINKKGQLTGSAS